MTTTYELTCAVCQQKKWPTLQDRPARYVCVLCRATPPGEGIKRRAAAQKASQTRKTRLRTPQDGT